MILVISPLLLSSCLYNDDMSGPSLRADDQWDQMAEERQKPFPSREDVINNDVDINGDEALDSSSSDVLLSMDMDESRRILQSLSVKYQSTSLSIDQALQSYADNNDKQDTRRTIEFYLSRLIIMEKNTAYAINLFRNNDDILEEDKTLWHNSREIHTNMMRKIVDVQNRLNQLTP